MTIEMQRKIADLLARVAALEQSERDLHERVAVLEQPEKKGFFQRG
jgi:hypothetical protein